MNEPEPPLLKRTDESWVCCSHDLVRSKPYFDLSCCVGGRLKSHMPSSAAAIPAKVKRATTIRIGRLMMHLLLRSSFCCESPRCTLSIEHTAAPPPTKAGNPGA